MALRQLEDLLQDVCVGGRVIYDHNLRHCHTLVSDSVGLPPCSQPSCLPCCAMASSRSSRVNGLVRYWSEPTTRPLALSNKPSLLVSMITGVALSLKRPKSGEAKELQIRSARVLAVSILWIVAVSVTYAAAGWIGKRADAD